MYPNFTAYDWAGSTNAHVLSEMVNNPESFNENFIFNQVYLSGVVILGIIGFAYLQKLKILEGKVDLDQFHDYSYKYPKLAFVFLLACLGISEFLITPTFIGKDLIFTHIHENQVILASFVSLSLIINGLAIIRIYACVFIRPHTKSQHEVADRSS